MCTQFFLKKWAFSVVDKSEEFICVPTFFSRNRRFPWWINARNLSVYPLLSREIGVSRGGLKRGFYMCTQFFLKKWAFSVVDKSEEFICVPNSFSRNRRFLWWIKRLVWMAGAGISREKGLPWWLGCVFLVSRNTRQYSGYSLSISILWLMPCWLKPFWLKTFGKVLGLNNWTELNCKVTTWTAWAGFWCPGASWAGFWCPGGSWAGLLTLLGYSWIAG